MAASKEKWTKIYLIRIILILKINFLSTISNCIFENIPIKMPSLSHGLPSFSGFKTALSTNFKSLAAMLLTLSGS